MIEYVLLFTIMAFMILKMGGLFGTFLDRTVGGLGHALTRQLSTGVCPSNCFFNGYANQ